MWTQNHKVSVYWNNTVLNIRVGGYMHVVCMGGVNSYLHECAHTQAVTHVHTHISPL